MLETNNRTVKSKAGPLSVTPVITHLSISTPYESGFMSTTTDNQEGKLEIGNIAPLKRNIGIIIKFIIRLNPSKDSILAAIIMPIPEIVNAIKNISGTTSKNLVNVNSIPSNGDKISIISPWMVLLEAPPIDFPIAIEVLLIGATSISLRNPNSRSQIIDIAENIDVKRSVITIIPGNIN